MKKVVKLILPAIMTVSLVLLSACGVGDTATTAGADTQTTGQTDMTFTLTELAQYDGTNGQPAYVAVDGVVYDVSDSTRWPEGVHANCDLGAVAGQDLSSVITQAPASMRSLLERMPVVGSLEQ